MKISETESEKSSERKCESAVGFLSFLTNEIHTVVASTVDDDRLPVTCAIDMMDCDENGLYFLTARGKGFYHRLKKRKFISITGIKGRDTMSSIAVSVRGHVEEAGDQVLAVLLEKNPYMLEIYPSEESRKALSAFRIYDGSGEFFDLSKRPIVLKSFSFGRCSAKVDVMEISDSCTGCGLCLAACPQQCIDASSVPFRIRSENCLMCGGCIEICPQKAVSRRKGS